MVQVRSRWIAIAAIAVAMIVAVAGNSTRSQAQDGTPMAGSDMAPIPNHIHTGTCENLTPEPLVPLADAEFTTAMTAAGTPMASPMAGMMSGASSAVPVAVATTQVDLPLADILAAEHAINLRDPAAPGDPSRYLACGAIGGTPDADGNLFVGLTELNDSGHHGIAWLLDNGAGTTITVFLAAADAAGAMMMATPTA